MIRPFLAFHGIIPLAYILLSLCPTHAQEATGLESGTIVPTRADVHLSFHVLRSAPLNRDLTVGGDAIPQTSVGQGIGGGFKAGIFPGFTNRLVGIEAETFGLGARVTAPRTIVGTGTRFADADCIAVTTMINLLVRYPGQLFQPYVGVGGGLSSGFLLNSDIQRGTDRITGNASSLTFAYQFLGGMRGYVTKKVFLFGEYKYFVAKYDWNTSGSGPAIALNFHAQLFSLGLGLSF